MSTQPRSSGDRRPPRPLILSPDEATPSVGRSSGRVSPLHVGSDRIGESEFDGVAPILNDADANVAEPPAAAPHGLGGRVIDVAPEPDAVYQPVGETGEPEAEDQGLRWGPVRQQPEAEERVDFGSFQAVDVEEPTVEPPIEEQASGSPSIEFIPEAATVPTISTDDDGVRRYDLDLEDTTPSPDETAAWVARGRDNTATLPDFPESVEALDATVSDDESVEALADSDAMAWLFDEVEIDDAPREAADPVDTDVVGAVDERAESAVSDPLADDVAQRLEQIADVLRRQGVDGVLERFGHDNLGALLSGYLAGARHKRAEAEGSGD